MSRLLLSAVLHLYAAAAILYLTTLIRKWPPVITAARLLAALGVVAHALTMGLRLVREGGAPVGFGEGLSAIALLLVVASVGLDVRFRQPVTGAFLLPPALVVLIGSVIASRGVGQAVEVAGPALSVHIVIALAGVAAFAVAASLAVMYLLLEHQMKGKRFGVLFSKLPPLQLLDDLNRHFIVWGFIALSVTLVTGTVFIFTSPTWVWSGSKLTTVVATAVAWLGSGALLLARVSAGWHGKRAAVLTMAGFLVLLVSLLTSYEVGRFGGGT